MAFLGPGDVFFPHFCNVFGGALGEVLGGQQGLLAHEGVGGMAEGPFYYTVPHAEHV